MAGNYYIVFVRIIDNVLPEEDRSEYELDLVEVDGELLVKTQITINSGVYKFNFIDFSPKALHEWVNYDPTGEHPEVWYEIYDPVSKKWLSCIDQEKVMQIILTSKKRRV